VLSLPAAVRQDRSSRGKPDKYLSSTLRKPGAEYATVFAFDKPGCYMVDLARAKTKAKVRITAA